MTAAHARRAHDAHARKLGGQFGQQLLGTEQLAAEGIANPHGQGRRRVFAVEHDVEMSVEACDLIDLDQRELHRLGERGEMPRVQAAEVDAAGRQVAWQPRRVRPDRPGGPLADRGRGADRNPAGWSVAACGLNRALVSSRYLFRSPSIVLPSAAGESDTAMPARFIASILSPAVPVPPEMIAPA